MIQKYAIESTGSYFRDPQVVLTGHVYINGVKEQEAVHANKS